MQVKQELIENASFIPLMHPITNAVVSTALTGEGMTPNTQGFTPLRPLALYFHTKTAGAD